jgi:hypothetical protein
MSGGPSSTVTLAKPQSNGVYAVRIHDNKILLEWSRTNAWGAIMAELYL